MESDLHQAECHEEELEKKRKGMEEQISLLSEKMKMIHDVLDHQQVELKKSKVYNELLENKHKVCEVYLLPARASEQGNVIGLVSVYIYIYIYI